MKYLLITTCFLLSSCSVLSTLELSDKKQGVVTQGGEPIAGAKIIFNAKSRWYGEWETQEAFTDDSGTFEIPQWKMFRFIVPLHQPVINQTMTIEAEGKSYQGWRYTSMSYSGDGGRKGLVKLDCNLDSAVTTHEMDSSRDATGICFVELQ